MIIFTSICFNYIHKAKVLAASVKENIPDAVFIVCLLERKIIPDIVDFNFFDYVFLAKDTWEGNFDAFIFKHSIVEAATSVKGQFFYFLYKRFPQEQQFVYLDPDIFVYDDFIELRTLLEKRPIIVCPHLLQPGNIEMELSSMAHGVFNLGFLAVNRMKDAVDFINWWRNRLSLYCYDDIINGIFTDQKWVSLAPCFYDIEILKHKGYDFATWSLLDCGLTENNGKYYIKDEPLRFIHFSGYGATIEDCMARWLPEEHLFKELYISYKTLHEKYDSNNISKTPWSYNCFFSGEPIHINVRKIYREYHYSPNNNINPFEYSNRFFLNYSKRNKRKENVYNKIYRIIKYEGIFVFLTKLCTKLKKVFII